MTTQRPASPRPHLLAWSLNDPSTSLIFNRPKQTPPEPLPSLESDTFLLLPQEILGGIISQPCLSKLDLKALRLVCHRFEPLASELLFRQIHLSRCIQHSFIPLNLIETPRIAGLVRELVWYELPCDGEIVQYFDQRLKVFNFEDAICKEGICKALSGIFPIPLELGSTVPGEDSSADGNIERFLEFQDRLFHMFDNLPRLETLISRPFPPDFVIRGDGYEFSAGSLKSTMTPTLPNDGLFTFLLPAMMRPTSRVKRLIWEDEPSIPSFERLEDLHIPAFANLESLDLCIAQPGGGRARTEFPSESLRRLGSCLQAAKGLRELTLCFEKGVTHIAEWPNSEYVKDNRKALKLILFDNTETFPNLTSLSLAYARCSDENLLPFLAQHSKNLRHLALRACVVTRKTMVGMREIGTLQLESIEIVPSEDHPDESSLIVPASPDDIEVEQVSSHLILDFINGKTQDCPITHRLFSTLSNEATFDPHLPLSSVAAFFDILEGDREDYGAEDIAAVQHIYEDNRTMSEPDDTDVDYSDRKQVRAFNTRKADHRHHHRSSHAPTWKWGRFDNGKIYYWPCTDGSGARTENWKFTSSYSYYYVKDNPGNVAYGNEPLEFFPDWNSEDGVDGAVVNNTEEGDSDYEPAEFEDAKRVQRKDVAVPVPFGRKLGEFVRRVGDLGDAEGMKGLPEGAVLYDSDDDPFA